MATRSEDAMGGVEKRGGWQTSRVTPLPKRGSGPPSYGTFSTPFRCQCSVFLCKNPRKSRPETFGGVQHFSGERVLWYFLHPPISWPNSHTGDVCPCFQEVRMQFGVAILLEVCDFESCDLGNLRSEVLKSVQSKKLGLTERPRGAPKGVY